MGLLKFDGNISSACSASCYFARRISGVSRHKQQGDRLRFSPPPDFGNFNEETGKGDTPLVNAATKMKKVFPLDVMGYGTTIDEKIFGLAGLQKLTMLQKEQSKDMKIHTSSRPVHRKITDDENVAIYVDEITISMEMTDGKSEFNVRVSTILEFQDGKWKVIHWHGSKPVESESDTWHKEEWKQKNEELEKLVEEKTTDLLNKNRELEIEAALERVRSRSMAMHKSSELLEVANVLFQQLRSLGGNLWASGIVICKTDSDDDEVWFANEKGVLPPIAVPHTEDPVHKEMYDGWKKKMDLFSELRMIRN